MFGVDRTSNRAWKRRRNWVIEARSVMRLNGYEKNEIIRRVMETRPGLDRKKVKQMVGAILDKNIYC